MSGILGRLEQKLEKRMEERLRERTLPIVTEMQRLHDDLVTLNKNIEKLIKTIEGKKDA